MLAVKSAAQIISPCRSLTGLDKQPHAIDLIHSYLVFHGGSGSSEEEIKTAVNNGVVKMNVDTDTQFAYLAGIRVSQCWLFSVFNLGRQPHMLRTSFKTRRTISRVR